MYVVKSGYELIYFYNKIKYLGKCTYFAFVSVVIRSLLGIID